MLAHPAMPMATIIRMAAIQDLFLMMPPMRCPRFRLSPPALPVNDGHSSDDPCHMSSGPARLPIQGVRTRGHLPRLCRGTPLAPRNGMRQCRFAGRLLVAILALLMLHSAARGQTGRTAQVYQMAGTCSVEVRPDAAVIVGGVAAGGFQPVEAVDKLEKQLALVRGYLDGNRGQLQLLERVRTLRNSPARLQDTEPPFQVVQRLRAELPVNAPIDQILQRLIELGLDRFGDDVLNTGGSRRGAWGAF